MKYLIFIIHSLTIFLCVVIYLLIIYVPIFALTEFYPSLNQKTDFILVLSFIAGFFFIRQAKFPKKINLFLQIFCPLFATLTMIYCFFAFFGDKPSTGSRAYSRCSIVLQNLKRAEFEYFDKKGEYTSNIEALKDVFYSGHTCLSKNCNNMKVHDYIEQFCSEYNISFSATDTINITGRSKDDFNCFVCDPPSDDYSIFGRWKCPTPDEKSCYIEQINPLK